MIQPAEPIRLLCMSDIHCEFDRFPVDRLPDADIVIIAGDFTNWGGCQPEELVHARFWMAQISKRYRRVLYVCGNHDFEMDNETFADFGPSLYGIERREFTDSHLTFRGASLSPCFDMPSLALAWCRMTSSRTIDLAEWDGLPYADIIVSHCPPEGIQDSAGKLRKLRDDGQFDWQELHLGSPGLLRYIQRNAPRLVVCGHIHEAAGVGQLSHSALAPTMVVNCARSVVLVTISLTTVLIETL